MPTTHSKENDLDAKAISSGEEKKHNGSSVMILGDMMRICQNVIGHLGEKGQSDFTGFKSESI